MKVRTNMAALTLGIGLALAGGTAGIYAPTAQAQIVCVNCSNIMTQLMQQAQEISAYAKQVDQYKTQLDQLNNQITQLANDARNLASLPTSILGQYQQVYDGYAQAINDLRGSMSELSNMRDAYQQQYPEITGDMSFQQLSALTGQWETSGKNNIEDALYSGAAVLDAMQATNQQFQQMGQASQGATGILQATQAGNQINMLVGQELMKLNTQTAAMNQALLEDQARQIGSEQRARANMTRAYDGTNAYTPSAVPPAPRIGSN